MIYHADQIQLWPRLLEAAKIDAVLLAALQDLMQRGAGLALNESGGLQLSYGTMPEADYLVIRSEKLAPRGPKMSTVLNTARTRPHPWSQSVRDAYTGLDKRTAEGDRALQEAITHKAAADVLLRMTTRLVDRHLQAMSLARALLDSGYGAYEVHASKHLAAFQDLSKALERSGRPFDGAGRYWPVQTPDGWLWVTDTPDAVPQPIDLGGEVGVRTPTPEEPAVTDWDLGRALAAIERLNQREAG